MSTSSTLLAAGALADRAPAGMLGTAAALLLSPVSEGPASLLMLMPSSAGCIPRLWLSPFSAGAAWLPLLWPFSAGSGWLLPRLVGSAGGLPCGGPELLSWIVGRGSGGAEMLPRLVWNGCRLPCGGPERPGLLASLARSFLALGGCCSPALRRLSSSAWPCSFPELACLPCLAPSEPSVLLSASELECLHRSEL